MSEALIQVLIRTTILSLLWLGIACAMRKRSAATQHAWLIGGLLGVLAVPMMHGAIHEFQVALLPAAPSVPEPSDVLVPGVVGLVGKPRVHSSEAGLPFGLTLFSLVWLAGSMVIVGRYLFGLARIRSWFKHGQPVGCGSGSVPTVVSEHISVPLTAWIGRSVILVPESWGTWTQERQEAVVQHELAHIRRGDWLSQLAARLACAALWPNPAVWLLARKSRFLAERAADDIVLASGFPPARYAQILLETAREVTAALPKLSVCMAHRPNVARRIELILHQRTERTSVSKAGLVAGALLVLGTSLPVAIMAITRHQAPVPKATKAIQGQPAQIFVQCCILKPGVLFSDTDLKIFAETHSSPKGKRAAKSSQSFVYSFPADSAKDLIAKWKAEGKVSSEPAVRTLSGQMAIIKSTSGNSDKQTMRIVPTIDIKGKLKLGFDYEVLHGKTQSTFESVTYTSAMPSSVVLSRRAGPNQPAQIVGVITVKIVDQP